MSEGRQIGRRIKPREYASEGVDVMSRAQQLAGAEAKVGYGGRVRGRIRQGKASRLSSVYAPPLQREPRVRVELAK